MRKKILIIDPGSGPGCALDQLLAPRHYQVRFAKSAETGWFSAVGEKPDLILIEPMLPHGPEGFNLIWRLRRHTDRQVSETPIIVVTGIDQTTRLNLFPNFHDGHYTAKEFLPVQGFLNKPLDGRLLIASIGELLGSQSQHEGSRYA